MTSIVVRGMTSQSVLARTPLLGGDDLGKEVRPVEVGGAVVNLDFAEGLELTHLEVAPEHVARAMATLLVLNPFPAALSILITVT